MLHVPYHDFNIFVRLLQEASIDPRVTEVCLTVYRVASNSRVINALINAARNGKKVNVVIELQARFDEEANIYWSRKLEEVGANVIFRDTGTEGTCQTAQHYTQGRQKNECGMPVSAPAIFTKEMQPYIPT